MKPQHFAFVAGTLLLIALALLLSGGLQTNSADKAAILPDRVITVTGEGEVRVKPDLAQVSVRIWTHGASATDAEALNLAFVKRVQTALTAAGAEPDSQEVTQTAPTTQTYVDATGATRVSGLEAHSTVKVMVKNLNKVQAVIDAALAAGATAVDAVTYTLDNPEPAKELAMKAALANARARATALVKVDGDKLGDLRASEALPVDTPPTATGMGSLTLKAQVRATFGY